MQLPELRPARALALGLALSLLAAVALGALPGCSSDAERFEQHRERAETYLRQGRGKEALIELRSALQIRPRDGETNLRIAEALTARGDLEDALFYYREARRLDPGNAKATLSEAMLLRFDETERARELVEGLVERQPENPLGYLGRSHVALVEGDTEEALRAVKRAVELDPDHPEVQSQLGVVHQARIRERQIEGETAEDAVFEAAIRAFERARELRAPAKKYREILHQARVLAAWPGHSDEAPAAYRRALESAVETGFEAPRQRAIREVLRYAREADLVELQRDALEQLVETSSGRVEAWGQLARLEERTGGDPRAVLERMLEAQPESAQAHRIYARFLFREGQPDEAVSYLKARAEEGIEPPALLGTAARMERRRGREEATGRLLSRLESEYPRHPETVMARARHALDEGEAERAAEELRELVANLESAEAQEMLAEALRRLGRFEEARAAVDDAIELRGRFHAPAQRLRMQLQSATGDCSGAVRTARELARRGHRLSLPGELSQARCLYSMGHAKRARRVLLRLLEGEGPAPVAAALHFARHEAERAPERVREVLVEQLEHRPGHVRLLEALARLDLRAGRAEDALARLDRALESASETRPELRAMRARVHWARGDAESALADAKRALEESEAVLPEAVALLATIHERRGEAQKAIEVLERAEERGTLPVPQRVLLGRLLLAEGRSQEARQRFEAVLEGRDDLPRVQNDLAYLLAEADEELDRALELARSAQQALGEDPSVADTLGYVYLKRGLANAAREQFEYAIELAEDRGGPRATYQYHLGLALRALDRSEEAGRAFERALEIDAEFPEAEAARRALEDTRAAQSAGVTAS